MKFRCALPFPFRCLALCAFFILPVLPEAAEEEKDAVFHLYAPSRDNSQLLVISARAEGEGLALSLEERLDLDFPAATITAHPDLPLLYVAANRTVGDGGPDLSTPAAVIELTNDGKAGEVTPFRIAHGTSYLSLDRSNRFLLASNYSEGHVDVYALDKGGVPGERISSVNEGKKNAHSVLVSPDNLFAYIPYVKENNAIFQYHFDPDTGALTPQERLDASPPEGAGPRHIEYHPTLSMVYFSNEQHLGVTVYEKTGSGALAFRQLCDLVGPEPPEGRVTASDLVITPDGRFLYSGIRGFGQDYNWISRHRVLKDGTLEHLGLTATEPVPWGLALSPGGRFLFATGFETGILTAFRIGADGDLVRVAALPWDPRISGMVTR